MQTFSSQYLKTYDILKYAVIGLEFEFYTKSSFTKLLELLNIRLAPVKIHGFRRYHSEFVPTADEWKIEPDLSGGENMVELVTGPMSYHVAVMMLARTLRFLQDYAFTTNQCSVHINISFSEESGRSMSLVNPLKLIMSLDEEEIYSLFPIRKDNIYARSIKRMLPVDGLMYVNNVNALQNNIDLPDTKYFGVNFGHLQKGRLEFRYIGGKYYHMRTNDILHLLDRMCLSVWNSMSTTLTDGEMAALKVFMEENWKKFRYLQSVDDFIALHPSTTIEVDGETDIQLLRNYFPMFKSKLYQLYSGAEKIEKICLNFYVQDKRLEVRDGEITFNYPIAGVDFLNCEIHNAVLSDCTLIDCKIDKCDLQSCFFWDSDAKDSRLFKTDVNLNSVLDACFYSFGFMDGTMNGGILRSGTMGSNSYVSSHTKKISAELRSFKPKEHIEKREDDSTLN